MNVRYLNGLGLVASQKRKIRDGKEFDKYFKAPLRSDPFLTYAGTTHDTINFMADIIKNTTSDTQEIAKVLKGANLDKTLDNIFNFVFNHVQYKPDDPTEEQLRRPARTWADRTSGVDCDCYSIFIGSILSNLRIPFALRMVKINGKPYFQHVYVIVPKHGKQSEINNRNNYYTVDPVLDTYNEEHPFTEKYDLFMQPIRYLNGATLQGLQGGNPLAYRGLYSHEAAMTPQENVIFFDGVNYYERDPMMQGVQGLNGLSGLGFLKKIFGAVKKAGSFIKRISKKAIKPIVYKKDDNGERTVKRKLFNLRNGGQQATALTPMQPIQPQLQTQALATPTIQQPKEGVSVADVANLIASADKGLNLDSILNVIDKSQGDKTMLKELVDAQVKANAGVSSEEARAIAKQTAEAEKSSIMKDVMDNLDRVNKAGFGGMSMQTILLILVGGGFLLNKIKSTQAA